MNMPDSWCCPSWPTRVACQATVKGIVFDKELCYSLGCYPDHINRIKKEREERKTHQQKPSDCGKCQVYRDGQCKNCYEVGLHCHKETCLTAEQYKEKTRSAIRQFVENEERKKAIEEEAEQRREQEDYNRYHPDRTKERTRQPDTNRAPPPIVNPPSQPDTNQKRIGRLVVRPCGHGIWSSGVCCCPNEATAKRLPKRFFPGGSGPLPSPDTIWDECRSYGCWPPPHDYE